MNVWRDWRDLRDGKRTLKIGLNVQVDWLPASPKSLHSKIPTCLLIHAGHRHTAALHTPMTDVANLLGHKGGNHPPQQTITVAHDHLLTVITIQPTDH